MRNLLRYLSTLTLCMIISFAVTGQTCDCDTQSGDVLLGPGAGANGSGFYQAVLIGHNAGHNLTAGRITYLGTAAGNSNTTGNINTGLGFVSLGQLTTGSMNTAVGDLSGENIITGSENTIVGYQAFGSNNNYTTQWGTANKNVAVGASIGSGASGTANNSVFIGYEAGLHFKGGDLNTMIGNSVGRFSGGTKNVLIGQSAGYANVGDGNIYLGAGMMNDWAETNYNDHLFIGNWNNQEFLVGDIANGRLGVNTITPQNALDVCGKIRGDEVIIENNWCDYVFYKNYRLPSLIEEAKHIEEEGHLIGFESEEEMNGEIHLSDVTKRQQVKIEEIILHLIQMEKENAAMRQRLEKLEAENATLKKATKKS